MERLEHETHFAGPQRGAAVFVECRDFVLAQPDFSGTGNIQPRQQSQQCRLASTGSTHYGDGFAPGNFQVNLVENG